MGLARLHIILVALQITHMQRGAIPIRWLVSFKFSSAFAAAFIGSLGVTRVHQDEPTFIKPKCSYVFLQQL